MAPASKPLDLPAVSFSLLPEDQHDPPHLEHSGPQFIQFGYNDGKPWTGYQECLESQHEGGGRYMRWIQPLESELSRQVEYDMDEQDKVWLDTLNAERKKEAIAPIAYEVFEVVMDKLEKEWFDLTKSIPKKSNAVPTDNEKCAICDDGECENSNAIVFCDGCNLAVHQDCYGVPYIPEGQWLCRKCTVSPDKPVDCVFCPQPFGAFKQTTTGHWGHLLCAIWIPETGVSNTVYMEPIDGVENVPKSRWKLNCYLCKKKLGACIQCSNRNCYTAYHVTCAREFGLEVRMKQPGSTGTSSGGELKSYCDKHGKVQWEQFSQSRAAVPSSTRIPSIPHSSRLAHHHPALSDSASLPSLPHSGAAALPPASPFALPASSASSASSPFPSQPLPLYNRPPPPPLPTPSSTIVPLASSKSLRSKKTHLSPIKQTPLIPSFIFDRIVAYVSKVKGLTGKKDVVSSVCRYWSLKREGRTGAPLLKRIHLEPWTASATSRLQSDADRAAKLELIKLLRTDLERVRMLTEQVRKREKKKLEKLKWFKETVLDGFVWPKETRLREALKEIISWDKQQYFLNPIDPVLVPDYHEIISSPMCWSTMSLKLDRHEYPTARSFADDALLVMSNAQKYNKPSTQIHKISLKLSERLEPLVAQLVKELDDPLSTLSVRESLAGRILREEFPFDPEEDVQAAAGETGKGGDETGGEGEQRKEKDTVVVLEELERVWYNVEDPLGDRKQKAAEAERERVKAEEDRIERERQERDRVERDAREMEEARARKLKEDEEEKAQAEREKAGAKGKGKGKGKAKNPDEDVEMAPITDVVGEKVGKNGRKRKVEGAEAEDGPTDKKKRKKAGEDEDKPKPKHPRKREPNASVPAPVEDASGEPEQTSISDYDTFKRFETGWVLPEGSSRRKTITPALPTVPLPGPSSTQAPVASTSTSTSNRTPRSTVNVPLPAATPTTLPDEATSKPSASRKAKEKAVPAPTPPPGGEGEQEEQKPEVERPDNWAHKCREWHKTFSTLSKRVSVKDEQDLSDGTLVWHKLAAQYPYYPAEIADPNDDSLPDKLVQARPAKRDGGWSKHLPLLYFDQGRTGAWALPREVRLLGEDKEFDQLMMTPEAVKSGYKTKSWALCVEYAEELSDAYEFALENVEIDGVEEEGSGAAASGKKKGRSSKPKRQRAPATGKEKTKS